MTLAFSPAARAADGGRPVPAAEDPALPLSRRYDVALLDLDGVVYRGHDSVPGAIRALELARGSGMRMAFVTNNASRSPAQVAEHLVGLGVPAVADEVVTSAQAAASLAAQRFGSGRRVFVVGSDALREALVATGQTLVSAYDAQPGPEIVVQGFSPDLRYEDLAQATLAIAAGAHWVATNTDTTLPTARGLQPGNGTLVAVVAAATGQRPLVAGKPERALVDEAVRRSGATRPLMIGDRLDTDIEGAVRAGMDSLLVLTGVSTVAQLLLAGPASRPTFLGHDLTAVGSALLRLSEWAAAPSSARSGWTASADGGRVTLARDLAAAGAGDPLDPIRTLVVAAWACADAGQPVTEVVAPAGDVRALVAAGVPADVLHAQGEGRSSDD